MPLTLTDLQRTTGTRPGMPFVRQFIQEQREAERLEIEEGLETLDREPSSSDVEAQFSSDLERAA